MDKTKIIEYCLTLSDTEEGFPFDDRTWVAKVYGKMFILMDIPGESTSINLKCDPEKSELLRAEYEFIVPGYHMNKRHWITVHCHQSSIDWNFLKELIQHSYHLVRSSTKRKSK